MIETSSLVPRGILDTWMEGTQPDPSALELAKSKLVSFTVTEGKYNPYHREGPSGATWMLRVVNRKELAEVCGIYLTASTDYTPTPADFLTACRRSIKTYLKYSTAKAYAEGEGLPYGTHYEVGEASFRHNTGLILHRHLQKVLTKTHFDALVVDGPSTTERTGEAVDATEEKPPVAAQPTADRPRSAKKPAVSITSLFEGL